MQKDNRNRKILCIALLTLWLCVIWGNSALPGEVSGEISGGVLDWVNDHCGTHITGFAVRKLAHFTEFAVLGLLLSWLGILCSQKGIHRVALPLLGGMLAACTDETIQVFVPERGPSVVDVWIDTAGALCGILALLALCAIFGKRKLRKTPLED